MCCRASRGHCASPSMAVAASPHIDERQPASRVRVVEFEQRIVRSSPSFWCRAPKQPSRRSIGEGAARAYARRRRSARSEVDRCSARVEAAHVQALALRDHQRGVLGHAPRRSQAARASTGALGHIRLHKHRVRRNARHGRRNAPRPAACATRARARDTTRASKTTCEARFGGTLEFCSDDRRERAFLDRLELEHHAGSAPFVRTAATRTSRGRPTRAAPPSSRKGRAAGQRLECAGERTTARVASTNARVLTRTTMSTAPAMSAKRINVRGVGRSAMRPVAEPVAYSSRTGRSSRASSSRSVTAKASSRAHKTGAHQVARGVSPAITSHVVPVTGASICVRR